MFFFFLLQPSNIYCITLLYTTSSAKYTFLPFHVVGGEGISCSKDNKEIGSPNTHTHTHTHTNTEIQYYLLSKLTVHENELQPTFHRRIHNCKLKEQELFYTGEFLQETFVLWQSAGRITNGLVISKELWMGVLEPVTKN